MQIFVSLQHRFLWLGSRFFWDEISQEKSTSVLNPKVLIVFAIKTLDPEKIRWNFMPQRQVLN